MSEFFVYGKIFKGVVICRKKLYKKRILSLTAKCFCVSIFNKINAE